MGFLEEACLIFDNDLALAQAEIMEAMATYSEVVGYDRIFTEKQQKQRESIFVKIKKFFAKIVSSLHNFKSNIQIEVDKTVRSAEFSKKLRKLHKELTEAKSRGVKNVTVIDVWTLREKYLEAVKDLKQYAKKFPKIKYKNTTDIGNDLDAFNKTMEKYKQELEVLSKQTVTVSLARMLDFIDDEVSGKGTIINSLNDAITSIQQMNNDCEHLEKQLEILGPDVIPHHIGLLRRVATGISGFLKKWTVKIITTFVLIVG